MDADVDSVYQSAVSIGQFSARVVANGATGGGYFRLEFESESDNPVADAQPGQFVMLRGAWGRDLINGRAFSVMEVDGRRRFAILAKAFGRGTSLMKAAQLGDRYTVTGPLGQGFPVPPARSRALLVAGGVGLPPLLMFARHLAGLPEAVRPKIDFMYGGRSHADLVLLDELRATGAELYLTTDDGSKGEAGRVTQPLDRLLKQARETEEGVQVFSCGPTPMLRAVRSMALAAGVAAKLCLEEQMACGFGVCLGCAVPVYGEKPYAYCCTDGPVFDAKDLRWS